MCKKIKQNKALLFITIFSMLAGITGPIQNKTVYAAGEASLDTLPVNIYHNETDLSFTRPWGTIVASVDDNDGINGSKYLKFSGLTQNPYAPTPAILFTNPIDITSSPANSKLRISMDLGETRKDTQFKVVFNENPSLFVTETLDNTNGYQTFDIDISSIRSQLGGKISSIHFEPAIYKWYEPSDTLKVDEISIGDYSTVYIYHNETGLSFTRPWGNIIASVDDNDGINGSKYLKYTGLAQNPYAPTPAIQYETPIDISTLPAGSKLKISMDVGDGTNDNPFKVIFNGDSSLAVSGTVDHTKGYQNFDLDISSIRSQLNGKISSIHFEGTGPNGWYVPSDTLKVDEINIGLGDNISSIPTPDPAPVPDPTPVPEPTTSTNPTGSEVNLYHNEIGLNFNRPWGNIIASIDDNDGVNGSKYLKYTGLVQNPYAPTPAIQYRTPIDISTLPADSKLKISMDVGDGTNDNPFKVIFNGDSSLAVSGTVDHTKGYQNFDLDISSIKSQLNGKISSIHFEGTGSNGWYVPSDTLKVDEISIGALNGADPVITLPPIDNPTTPQLPTTPEIPQAPETPTTPPTSNPTPNPLPVTTDAIIADHNSTNLDSVPVEYINKAKELYKIYYTHLSHGSQIISGMGNLKGSVGSTYYFNTIGDNGALLIREGYGDLGHNGNLDWVKATRDELNKPNNNINVIMWSWCSGVSDNTEQGINAYLNAMNQLEQEYPNVKFIYMTGHLDGTGVDGNLNKMNNLIRDYVRANNKILFDFADIESYDPDGNYFLDKGAYDSCDYNGGNWADQWTSQNPSSPLNQYCESAHSKPLNANLKARAFWWMLAKMAGWK